jgi:hypothetical protein
VPRWSAGDPVRRASLQAGPLTGLNFGIIFRRQSCNFRRVGRKLATGEQDDVPPSVDVFLIRAARTGEAAVSEDGCNADNIFPW